jgi:hypothetical protein
MATETPACMYHKIVFVAGMTLPAEWDLNRRDSFLKAVTNYNSDWMNVPMTDSQKKIHDLLRLEAGL